jgi:hypothetical protein
VTNSQGNVKTASCYLDYFPTAPQSGKPVVLLQMAVRLTVDVVTITLVRVETPNDTKKRLAPTPSGSEKPDSISNGITESAAMDWI